MELIRTIFAALCCLIGTAFAYTHGGYSYGVTQPVPAGVTSSPSYPFTVAVNSVFNGAHTVTISDGSQGGTITPSIGSPGTNSITVTPPVGATSFTFTYTPASTGNKTISFTNGQSWPNPQPIVYYANTTSASTWFGDTWNNPSGADSCTGCSHSIYHSNIMNQDIGFNIYLPPGYSTSTHYPVVYFFPGEPGNENGGAAIIAPTVQSKIVAATVKPMIWVFPKVGWHEMDAVPGAPAYGAYMAESTIIYELIPYIDATYSTIASAAGRAIQGGSMGGQGCERLGFKFPQLFSSMYCFMPAIDDRSSNIASNEPGGYTNMLNSNAAAYDPMSVWDLSASNVVAIKAKNLPLHVTIGDQDSLYGVNVTFLSQLDTLGISHDAMTTSTGCGHDIQCNETFVSYANIDFASAHFP